MKSYPLISSLAEARKEPEVAAASRLWVWLKERFQPAAPSKPMDQMTDEEFDRLGLF